MREGTGAASSGGMLHQGCGGRCYRYRWPEGSAGGRAGPASPARTPRPPLSCPPVGLAAIRGCVSIRGGAARRQVLRWCPVPSRSPQNRGHSGLHLANWPAGRSYPAGAPVEGGRPRGRPRAQIAPPAVSAGSAAVASASEAAVEAAPLSPPVSRRPSPLPSPPASPRPSLLAGRLGRRWEAGLIPPSQATSLNIRTNPIPDNWDRVMTHERA